MIDLHYVDELIAARQQQHGGGPGAPPIQAGHRVGASINRSCIVMLSALLQGYVEDVFVECSQTQLPKLVGVQNLEAYRDSFRRWGNPNASNIEQLFLRLGVAKVLDGLSWQKMPNNTMRSRLDEINQLRNGIAHGRKSLTVNRQPFSLRLKNVTVFRDFTGAFGERFKEHVLKKIQ